MAKKQTDPETKPPEGGAPAPGHPALVVTAPAGPRRRIGRAFGPSGITIEAGTLSAEEIDALSADPLLVVRPAEIAPKDGA